MGDGGGFRSPMAIAVIGGLIMSTLLSLVFVPAAFTVMDDLGHISWGLFSRLVGLRASITPPSGQPGAIAEDEAGEDHSGAGGVGGLLSPPDGAGGSPR